MFSLGEKSGQAMIEYVLVFIILIGVVGALMFFIGAAREYTSKTVDLVSSEYP